MLSLRPAGAVSVGLDYVDFLPVSVDLTKSHVLAVYGKKEFGKTKSAQSAAEWAFRETS